MKLNTRLKRFADQILPLSKRFNLGWFSNRKGLPTERNFGFVFSAVSGLVFFWMLIFHHETYLWIALLTITFFILGFTDAIILRPLNLAWFFFGKILAMIFSPILLCAVFLLVLTPTGLIMRLFRYDPLGLTFEKDLKTYWIMKSPIDTKSSMKNQF